jgi:hypothetical protein
LEHDMDDPNRNQAQQLEQFRKALTAKVRDEGHTQAMIAALDRKYPGAGPQVLQAIFATGNPVESFVTAGMAAVCEAAERPRDPRDAQAEAAAKAAETSYDEMRQAQRQARRERRGR